jgi:prepilin-type processing-associated H-X9-DG protein
MHHGVMPPNQAALVTARLLSEMGLRSPLDPRPAPKVLEDGTMKGESSYVMVDYKGMKISDAEDPGQWVLFYEDHDAYNSNRKAVAFLDGHVSMLPEEWFQRRLKETEDWIVANAPDGGPVESDF